MPENREMFLEELSPEQQQEALANLRPAAPEAAGFDPVDIMSPEELAELSINSKGKDFDPVQYAASNPDKTKDPNTVAKLADTYGLLKQRGFKLKDIDIAEATKGFLQIFPSMAKWAGTAMELGVVNPLLGAVTPDLRPDAQEEFEKLRAKKSAELVASTELGVTGLGELAQKGAGKVSRLFGVSKDPNEQNPQERVNDFWDAVGMSQQRQKITEGAGTATTAVLGGVVEDLAKSGVKPNPEVVAELAAGDPVTFLAFPGGFKLVGATGKALGVVGSRAEAVALVTAIRKAQRNVARARRGAEAAAGRVAALEAGPSVAATTVFEASPAVEAAAQFRAGLARGEANIAARGVKAAQAGVAEAEAALAAAPRGTRMLAEGRTPIVNRLVEPLTRPLEAAGGAAASLVTRATDVGLGLGAGATGAALRTVEGVGKGIAAFIPPIATPRALRATYELAGKAGQRQLGVAKQLISGAREGYSPSLRLLSDVARGVPTVASGAAKGFVTLDIPLAAVSSETPADTAHMPVFGAFLGAAGRVPRAAGRVVQGQTIAPRAWGSDAAMRDYRNFSALDEANRFSNEQAADPAKTQWLAAIREFLAPTEAQLYWVADEAMFRDALQRYLPGAEEAWLNEAAKQRAVTVNLTDDAGVGRKVILLRDANAAPHEAFHPLQDVLGERAMSEIDQLIYDEYAPVWDQLGENYVRQFFGSKGFSDYQSRGEGWQEAILDLTSGSREWRNQLDPSEVDQVANTYLSREISAEVGDAVLRSSGPELLDNTSFPGKLARILGKTMVGFGLEPFEGVRTEGQAVPLRMEPTQAIKEAFRTGAEGLKIEQKRPDIGGIPPYAPRGRPTPSPAAPVSSAGETVATPETAATEARAIAADASEAPTFRGQRSPREILGELAETIASGEGVKVDYRSAPGEPAGAVTSNRAARRAIIEAFRTMPASSRSLFEKLFFPDRVVRTGKGIQVMGWAPEVFAANAHKLAQAVKQAGEINWWNQKNPHYEIDAKTGSFTEAGWRSLYDDATAFSKNQLAGLTGAGEPLVVPQSVVERGFTQPARRGEAAGQIEQGRADVVSALFGIPIPKTPRVARGRFPRNLAGQEVSEATAPGRVTPTVEPRAPFAGEVAEEMGIAGRQLQEVNPARAEWEAKGVKPSMIEAIQRLNLDNIADVGAAVGATPIRGVEFTLQAGFQPKPREPRAVKAAAVRDANGKVFAGSYHGAAIDNAISGGAKKIPDYFDPSWDVQFEVGFVTNAGEFLSRDQAFARGVELKQIPEDTAYVDADGVHTRAFKAADPTFQPRFEVEYARGGKYILRDTQTKDAAKDSRGVFDLRYSTKEIAEAASKMETPVREPFEVQSRGSRRPGRYMTESEHRVINRDTGEVLKTSGSSYIANKAAEQANLDFFQKSGGGTEAQFQPRALESTITQIRDADLATLRDIVKNTSGRFGEGLTGFAYDLGAGIREPAQLRALNEAREFHEQEALAAIKTEDFDTASVEASKGQLFREAVEFATGEGSGGFAQKRDFPDFQPPMKKELIGGQFQPAKAGLDREAIRMAAIRLPDGTIHEGLIHGLAWEESGLSPIAENRPIALQAIEEGFVTTNNRFVNREQAFEIGRKADQIAEDSKAAEVGRFLSLSEDRPALESHAFNESRRFQPKPNEDVEAVAVKYSESSGIPYTPSKATLTPKLDTAKKIADFYEAAKSDPTNEEVAASYDALSKEIIDQWRAIEEAGYKLEPWTGKGEPYKNSDEMTADVRENKHLYFNPTGETFKSESSNPMLKPSGIGDMPVNDIFRAVHDFFGHAKEGYQFGPKGELNAWKAHSEMFSPEAQGALAAETLAQNSWVNFGKHLRNKAGGIPAKGEEGYVPPTERPFAEQKNIVIPEEMIQEARGQSAARFQARVKLTEEDKPLFAENAGFGNFWVSPSGEFFRVGDHREWAKTRMVFDTPQDRPEVAMASGKRSLAADSEEALKNLGWVRVSRNREGGRPEVFLNANRPLTEKQQSAFEVWEAENPNVEITDARSIFFSRRGDGGAQFQSAKKTKEDFKMPTGVAGSFSKAWIQPNGEPIVLGGKWHHDWLNENAEEVSKRWNIPLEEAQKSDAEGSRESALKAGFARVNLGLRNGALTIELRGSDLRKHKKAIYDLVEQNSGLVDSISITLMDDSVKNVVDRASNRVFEFNDKEKLDHIPFVTGPPEFAGGAVEAAPTPSATPATPRGPGLVARARALPGEEGPAQFQPRQEGVLVPGKRKGTFVRPERRGVRQRRPADWSSVQDLGEEFFQRYGVEELRDSIKEGIEDLYTQDPKFREKVDDVVGVHLSYSVEENARISADRIFGDLSMARRNSEAVKDLITKKDPDLAQQLADFESTWGRGSTEFSGPLRQFAREKMMDLGLPSDVANTALRDWSGEGREIVEPLDQPLTDFIEKYIHRAGNLHDIYFQGRFQPRGETEGLPGFDTPREVLTPRQRAEMSLQDLRKHFPEAVVPREIGDPVASDIVGSPLYKRAGSESEAVTQFAKRLVDFAREYESDPAFEAGKKWYSDFTPMLKKQFGKDSQLMAELLAATSPNTGVEVNYKYAFDALKSLRDGRFNKIIPKFEEGLEKIGDGSWEKWYDKELKAGNVESPPQNPSPAAFLAHWVNKFDLKPKQSNGKLYGQHSISVLKVFARRWIELNAGPKTRNFVENLMGQSHEATIDVWADRTMRWAGYEGLKERWRILPENKKAVDDADFAFSQKVFRAAAEELGMKPDDLQGALWFAEKKRWADNGWGRLDMGDFREEIKKTPALEKAYQQRKAEKKADKVEQLGLDVEPRFK